MNSNEYTSLPENIVKILVIVIEKAYVEGLTLSTATGLVIAETPTVDYTISSLILRLAQSVVDSIPHIRESIGRTRKNRAGLPHSDRLAVESFAQRAKEEEIARMTKERGPKFHEDENGQLAWDEIDSPQAHKEQEAA